MAIGNSVENLSVSYECDLTAERDRLRAINAELATALELLAQQCEDHPVYMPDATDEDMLREGGDAATITYWAQVARAALAKAKTRT